jgi:predicted DNA-binding ribbon-helix-helix protein
MSKQLLNNYYNKLEETIRFGGSRNETTVEHAFIQLVNSYAERRNLMLVPKIAIKSTKGTNIIPDGALKSALRLDFGYWESKDTKDDIDREIQAKINKGYPLTNTLFEDSQTAVLFQENVQVLRIKDTFVKNSTAQKTKVYDMYARFYRWAMDRIDENGVIAFVTNRSFIDSRTFDGFRQSIEDDFDFAYIVDTRSDVRANPKIAGTSHNVFGIQTGVAVMFLVKVKNES